MSLAFTRLSPTPIVQTLHHSPSEAEVKLWAHYPEAPFIAISNEQARLLSGFNVVGTVLHGIDTDRFTFRESAGRLPAVPRALHGRQGSVLQAIEVARRRRHAADPGGGRRATTIRSTSRHSSTGSRSSTSAKPTSMPRSACTAAPGRCSIRFRRASRSASCWRRPWRAARRSPRWTAAPSAKSSTTASPASCSTTSTQMVEGLSARGRARPAARPRAGGGPLRRRAHGARIRRRVPAGRRGRIVHRAG